MNKFEKCLEEWNGGFRGAKIRLARELKVDDSTVSAWLKGRSKPGKDKITKMSKIFKKSEKEIKAMFIEDNSVNHTVGRDNHGTTNQGCETASGAEIKALASRIEQVGKDIQILNLKIDLILEKLRKGK